MESFLDGEGEHWAQTRICFKDAKVSLRLLATLLSVTQLTSRSCPVIADLMLSLLEPDLTCPIKHEMPELSPAAAAVGEMAGGDSPSRDGIHQQSSIGSLGSAAYQTLPQHNWEYLQASYWDERFKHEGAYEWYADYRQAGAGAVTIRSQPHCTQR